MSVNTELVRKGIFFQPDQGHPTMDLASMIIEQKVKEKTQETLRQALASEWEDTTRVIVTNVLEAGRKSASAGESHGA